MVPYHYLQMQGNGWRKGVFAPFISGAILQATTRMDDLLIVLSRR